MDVQAINIAELVSKITQEVLGRIEYANQSDEDVKGTVALFTSFVPSKVTCADFLKKQFGSGLDCVLLNNIEFSAPGCFAIPVKDDNDKDKVIQKLAGAAGVVLVTPKLDLLYKLAEGDDRGFVEHLFLRPLLWGRKASIVLDFTTPKFRRATFFEKVVDAIDILEKMGVSMLSYQPTQEQNTPERKLLVTEQDVLDASIQTERRLLCSRDVIITPLAKERAAELAVSIDF